MTGYAQKSTGYRKDKWYGPRKDAYARIRGYSYIVCEKIGEKTRCFAVKLTDEAKHIIPRILSLYQGRTIDDALSSIRDLPGYDRQILGDAERVLRDFKYYRGAENVDRILSIFKVRRLGLQSERNAVQQSYEELARKRDEEKRQTIRESFALPY